MLHVTQWVWHRYSIRLLPHENSHVNPTEWNALGILHWDLFLPFCHDMCDRKRSNICGLFLQCFTPRYYQPVPFINNTCIWVMIEGFSFPQNCSGNFLNERMGTSQIECDPRHWWWKCVDKGWEATVQLMVTKFANVPLWHVCHTWPHARSCLFDHKMAVENGRFVTNFCHVFGWFVYLFHAINKFLANFINDMHGCSLYSRTCLKWASSEVEK